MGVDKRHHHHHHHHHPNTHDTIRRLSWSAKGHGHKHSCDVMSKGNLT